MKLLILGGRGMAGHTMVKYFQQRSEYNVFFTSRDKYDSQSIYLDLLESNKLKDIIYSLKPDIVINCVGLLNEHAHKNVKSAILINSLLPHVLSELTESYGGMLIHISTDCVFSGVSGDYKENDDPDGTSVYAKTKALGEIISNRHLTIRTSIIGPEIKETGIGLFHWFMRQAGEIKGYKKVLWNGVTTLELANAVDKMIEQNMTGIYHLGTKEKISKYELLKMIQKVFDKNDVTIKPDEEIILNRTLGSSRKDFQYLIPSYETMLTELNEWMLTNESYS
jgi:dTDP-4-dehydrorhamnose reductase